MTDVVLFCPFCRESFEEETACPEHELELVPFRKLPPAPHEMAEDDDWEDAPDAGRQPTADAPIPLLSPRYGRGAVALGALVTTVGFLALPFTAATLGHEQSVVTGLELANHRATNLWIILMVVLGQLGVLVIRRTPRALAGARLTWPILSLTGCASLAYTLSRIVAGTRSVAVSGSVSGSAITPASVAEYGVWVMLAGLVLSALGGLRAGR